MKKILVSLFVCLVACGCFSTKTIGVNTVSSYEKRYDSSANIVIDGNPIEIPEGRVVWVLRGETLEVLLSTASANNLSTVKPTK